MCYVKVFIALIGLTWTTTLLGLSIICFKFNILYNFHPFLELARMLSYSPCLYVHIYTLIQEKLISCCTPLNNSISNRAEIKYSTFLLRTDLLSQQGVHWSFTWFVIALLYVGNVFGQSNSNVCDDYLL